MQRGMFHHGHGGVIGLNKSITVVFGDGLAVPSVDTKAYIARCGIRGVFIGWSIVADISGSCTIDVQKSQGISSPSFSSIVGSAIPPTLSSSQASVNNPIISWKNNTFVESDILMFNLSSVSTCKKITMTLEFKVD